MKNKKKKKRWDSFGSAMAAVIPLIGFLIFGTIPLTLALVVSMTELHSADLSEMVFVGLDNFKTILTNGDKRTYASYLSTIVYALNAPISIALSLFIANLIIKAKRTGKFFSIVFFIPYVCSVYAVGMIFKNMYQGEAGVFNSILASFGFVKIGWLTDSVTSYFVSIIIMTVWKGLSFCIVLYMAALSNVDQSYYEAAKIDGASSAQIFWKITWPAITPTTSYLVTMKIIWALQAMAETHVMAQGSMTVPRWPNSEGWVSDLVVKHIYNMVFVNPYQHGYGLAAAAGWILAILVFIITGINLRLQKRWVNYDF